MKAVEEEGWKAGKGKFAHAGVKTGGELYDHVLFPLEVRGKQGGTVRSSAFPTGGKGQH